MSLAPEAPAAIEPLIGTAPPSPAGPIDEAQATTLPAPPQIDLPA